MRTTRPQSDIARAALLLETTPLPRTLRRQLLSEINAKAEAIRTGLKEETSADRILATLNAHFFGPEAFAPVTDMTALENVSLAAVLENRRGTCVGLAIVYLALAQRLGLEAHAVATPVHLLVRVRLDDRVRNVELLEAGREIDDATYRRRYRMDEASIASGVFMRDLTNAEVIAHLLANQAVALSKDGKLDEALARYDSTLELAPQLVAAWYNRGIDLMNAGRLHDSLASFDRAIALHSSDAQAHNNRGLAKMKLGDVEGARTDWMRALEIEPGMREAEANLRKLQSGAAKPPTDTQSP